jgi:phosphatidylserine/phosphatidylglycerophosphate/cardiolipin synthase-like enzyme
MCEHLQVASLQSSPAKTWPNGKGYSNHSKIVAVDDTSFYIGSQNFYPAWLQEQGFVVEDPTAASTFVEYYKNPAWEWSRETAIVDPDQDRCSLT